jgi:glycerol-3-phosphate acyltransferase PlsY
MDSLYARMAVVGACYLLGCVVAAYYLVRWRTGGDVRALGSGTAGARNAGRVLGRKASVAVALADIGKGAAAMLLARAAGLSGWWTVAAGLAVVAGHVWPAQLRFRGGKGIATGWGAILADSPLVGLAMLAFAIASRPVFGSFLVSGLAAFVFGPILQLSLPRGWSLHYSESPFTLQTLTALLIFWTHRANVAEEIRRRRGASAADQRHQ